MSDLSTGTGGILRIQDLGSVVQFWIIQTNSATHVNPLNWSGVVNGQPVGGSIPNWVGVRSELVWQGVITTSQVMQLSIPYTGTAGFGGPATNYTAISRATVPPAPINGVVDQPTQSSLRYSWTGNGDGGSGILVWNYQYSTTPNFSSGNSAIIDSFGSPVVTGLIPGTTYYFRARGVNAIGVGAWGAIASGATLPATPPGMTVTPSLSGTSASVALTPPGGVSGVVSYTVERRLVGSTAAVSVTGSSPIVITGLIPGATYEWRALATFPGPVTSPWTDWTPITQPNPSTNPGDFFDGNTPDTGDVIFAWTGAQNNSTSTVTGVTPLGWAASATTGSGIIQRVTGGRSGTYGARVTVLADATNVRSGMDPVPLYAADVQAGALYFGSIYVSTSSDIVVTPEITWLTTAGAVLSRTAGDPVSVSPTDGWARVIVSGVAPTGADFAAANILLPTAEGGTSLLLDDAMVTLSNLYPWFSGDSPDTDQFHYDWVDPDAPNASASTRTESQRAPVDPLIDPDCDPIPQPPRPPVVPDPCVTETGTWQRYWYTIPASEISEWLSILPTLTISTGCNPDPTTGECRPVRQARIRYYSTDLPPSQADTTSWMTEQIISFIPVNTVLTLDAVTQRAWASVDGGPQLAADHLLYGTGGVPATWATLSCGTSYLISIDVPPGLFIDAELFLSQRT